MQKSTKYNDAKEGSLKQEGLASDSNSPSTCLETNTTNKTGSPAREPVDESPPGAINPQAANSGIKESGLSIKSTVFLNDFALHDRETEVSGNRSSLRSTSSLDISFNASRRNANVCSSKPVSFSGETKAEAEERRSAVLRNSRSAASLLRRGGLCGRWLPTPTPPAPVGVFTASFNASPKQVDVQSGSSDKTTAKAEHHRRSALLRDCQATGPSWRTAWKTTYVGSPPRATTDNEVRRPSASYQDFLSGSTNLFRKYKNTVE